MTLRYLLDTDTCIYVLKHRTESLRQRFNAAENQLAISTITLFELAFGAEKSAARQRNLRAIEDFTSRLQLLDFDQNTASHAADIRNHLRQTGQPIGPYDTLIAATARNQGLILVTNNLREFTRVEGLRVENWLDD